MMKRLFLVFSLVAILTAVCGVHAYVPDPAKAYSFESSKTLVPRSLSGWIICHNDPVNKLDPNGKVGMEFLIAGCIMAMMLTPENTNAPVIADDNTVSITPARGPMTTIVGAAITGRVIAGLVESIAQNVFAEAPEQEILYHYTDAPEESFQKGLWSGSSATDNPNLSPQEAVEQLGVKTVPDKIIPIQNNGNFIPNSPPIVEPHPNGPGGGTDFTNPVRVSPDQIRSCKPYPS